MKVPRRIVRGDKGSTLPALLCAREGNNAKIENRTYSSVHRTDTSYEIQYGLAIAYFVESVGYSTVLYITTIDDSR